MAQNLELRARARNWPGRLGLDYRNSGSHDGC